MSTTPSPIQERTSKTLQKTHQLVHNADLQDSDRALAVDADTRFRLWAGNIGAYHPISDPRSADARLKGSPEVVNRLVEVLNELCEIQTEAQDIMNGARPDGSLVPDEQRPGAESSPNEDTTELHELLLSITDLLQSLFKISILIRKATHRDRYAVAARARYPTFLEDPDIRHVGDKFPKLLQDDQVWLQKRLGRAITQRRQFLRYCRDHKSRLSLKPEAAPQDLPLILAQPVKTSATKGPTESRATDSRPTLASTKASTANARQLATMDFKDLEQGGEDDSRSEATSFVSTMHTLEGSERLIVSRLSDHCCNGQPFECPYCRGIVHARKQRTWRNHVLQDLRAYVCTFEDCDAGLFESEDSWFLHETEVHRREWSCPTCPDQSHDNPHGFNKHLKEIHGTLDDDLDATLQASSSPAVEVPSSSCMLCDEWDAKLRLEATSKGVPESHVLLIPIEKLRRHLAQHMEQLALFAIPPSVDSDVRSSECTSEGPRERKDELLADWHDGVVSEDGEGDESSGETKPIIPQEAPELVIPAAAGNSESDTSLWRPVYTQGPSDTPLPIVPLGDIPTLNEIYRRSQPGIPSVAHVRYGDVFSLVRADIATLEVDAIVHPTNFDLTGGSLSVYERAGPELLQECRTLKPIDAGDAVMTKAYGLPCKWVIHTRGPTYLPGESDRLRWLLQRCYRRSLDLALKMGCESLAFTAISTGLKRYPIEEAVDVAIDTITSWLNACSPKVKVFKKIVFCVHTKEDENAYISLLRRVQQDLDERSS